ncbi:MAG: prolipoprotein diacylglyceryl transferase [Propionibacteriaceae bacterium]|nr:prolipoprotein diacylglyceryl transferase [Propionibacteriaceae bacterium]
MPLFLPSPAHGVWYLGPVPIRGYAMSILAGIVVAFILARHRWKKWGGDTNQFETMTLVSVIVGIIGARIYWIIIEWPRYFGPEGTWYRMFFVWEGGLGIWGGITFGFITGWLLCRHYKIPFLRLADSIAPAFLIAQGIGRLGNWWNQELYGLPTTLPWALKIDVEHRVAGYEQYATFHPTFLYEMLWDILGALVLLWLERRFRLGRGKVFALYIAIYAIGRCWIEFLRIDPVQIVGGLRINVWPTMAGGVVGIVLFLWLAKHRPGPNEIIVGDSETEPESVADSGAGPGSVVDSEAETAPVSVCQDAHRDPTDEADEDG